MCKKIVMVVKHLAVAEDSVVMCTAQPSYNIICDAAYVITHNKCTQQAFAHCSLPHLLFVTHRSMGSMSHQSNQHHSEKETSAGSAVKLPSACPHLAPCNICCEGNR